MGRNRYKNCELAILLSAFDGCFAISNTALLNLLASNLLLCWCRVDSFYVTSVWIHPTNSKNDCGGSNWRSIRLSNFGWYRKDIEENFVTSKPSRALIRQSAHQKIGPFSMCFILLRARTSPHISKLRILLKGARAHHQFQLSRRHLNISMKRFPNACAKWSCCHLARFCMSRILSPPLWACHLSITLCLLD